MNCIEQMVEIQPVAGYNQGNHKVTSAMLATSRGLTQRSVIPMDTPDSTTHLKRCTKCGQVKPFTVEFFRWRKDWGRWCTQCRQCEREYNKHYQQSHLEKMREQIKHWNQTHPEQMREIRRRHYQTHPEKKQERGKRYWQNHPEKAREYSQRRYARKRSLPHTFTEQDWQRALEYFHGCCAYCGNPPSLFDLNAILHQEHHLPLSKGGGYTPDNIVPACQSCNLSKHDKDALEWLTEKYNPAKAKRKLKEIKAYFASLGESHD